MVEGSLQQLTDQLARAGIKVDMGAGKRGGRRCQTRTTSSIAPTGGTYRAQSRLSDNEPAELNGPLSAEAVTTTISNRVGASGVNLYA